MKRTGEEEEEYVVVSVVGVVVLNMNITPPHTRAPLLHPHHRHRAVVRVGVRGCHRRGRHLPTS